MKSFTTALLACLCLLGSGQAAAEASLQIRDAWIREAPPTAKVLAAYMELHNSGTTPAIVRTIHSPDFSRIEIHRTVVERGVARMLPVELLQIPPAGKVVLEPGGMHLMLFTPARPLRQDDQVSMTIELANGACRQFEATVIRRTGDDGYQHHHHNH